MIVTVWEDEWWPVLEIGADEEDMAINRIRLDIPEQLWLDYVASREAFVDVQERISAEMHKQKKEGEL